MAAKNFDFCIIDNIDEGIIALEGGIVHQVNRAMESLTGLVRSRLIGQPLAGILNPLPDEFQSYADASARSKEKAPVYESALRRVDGQTRAVAVSMHAVPGLLSDVKVVVIRDIAERKKMQQELLKARQLESIAALSGGIAHDYNNLLTAIMGNISLALTGIPEDDAIYDWLSQAQEAALIAKELTNRLITFSKGGVPQKETVDIGELLESATEFALSGSTLKFSLFSSRG